MSYFLAILKAIAVIPSLKQIWDDFVSWYVAKQIAEMQQETREAIRVALQTYDQRKLEEAIKNPAAGELSGVPGSIIIGDLPGVPKAK